MFFAGFLCGLCALAAALIVWIMLIAAKHGDSPRRSEGDI